MSGRQKARYAAGLQGIASQHAHARARKTQLAAESRAHELDVEEVAAGRKRKRAKVPIPTAEDRTNPSTALQVPSQLGSSSATTRAPGPAGVLLQPGYAGASAGRSRKTREAFIAQSINAAVSGAQLGLAHPSDEHQRAPQAPAAPSVNEVGNEDENDNEGDNEDADMVDKSDTSSNDGHDGDSSDNGGDNDNDSDNDIDNDNDNASNGRPAEFDQSTQFSCTIGPTHRDEFDVTLSGYVRAIIFEYLKRKHLDDPLPPGPPPEVAAPTPQAFYIRWNESESSLFNETASRIVANRVLKDWPGLFNDRPRHVLEYVKSHIKYMILTWKRENIPDYIAKEPARLLRCSATTRRYTLYNHRLQIILAIPALNKHGRLIQTLGPEGTSSDEEEPGNPGVYIIKRRKELSDKVQHLKRQLDQAYVIHFKGPGSKGNQCRKRIDYGALSKRRLKTTGLPLSCINQEWYNTLTDVQREMFDFRDQQYDYSFPLELLTPPN